MLWTEPGPRVGFALLSVGDQQVLLPFPETPRGNVIERSKATALVLLVLLTYLFIIKTCFFFSYWIKCHLPITVRLSCFTNISTVSNTSSITEIINQTVTRSQWLCPHLNCYGFIWSGTHLFALAFSFLGYVSKFERGERFLLSWQRIQQQTDSSLGK